MKPITEIIAVLDKSGSMRSYVLDTVRGFNQFVQEQKSVEGQANLTLVEFNSQVTPVYVGQPLNTLPALRDQDFKPRGQTALFDAIGKTIVNTEARLSRVLEETFSSSRVIFAIMTDGQENASSHYKLPTVVEMIKRKHDVFGWEFYYFAANESAKKQGQKLGLSNDRIFIHNQSSEGFKLAYKEMSRITTTHRIEWQPKKEKTICL